MNLTDTSLTTSQLGGIFFAVVAGLIFVGALMALLTRKNVDGGTVLRDYDRGPMGSTVAENMMSAEERNALYDKRQASFGKRTTPVANLVDFRKGPIADMDQQAFAMATVVPEVLKKTYPSASTAKKAAKRTKQGAATKAKLAKVTRRTPGARSL